MALKHCVIAASILALAGCSSGQPAQPSDTNASGVTSGAGSASSPLAEKSREEWRKEMSKTPPPKAGCFTVSHPSMTWVETPCTKPPPGPLVPRKPGAHPATVGGGGSSDWAAQGTHVITSAEGAFPLVTGVTSTNEAFTLQLNTQASSQTPYCYDSLQDPRPTCQEWQQFVYLSGEIYIQYWLIEYPGACPSGWTTYANGTDNDCYWTTVASYLPAPTLADLGNVTLTGVAGSTNDTVTMSVGTGTLYSVSQASLFALNDWWTDAEFNVFGPGNGSGVDLNAGSTLLVRTSVDTASPSSVVSCLQASYTGETNNLNLVGGSCCALNGLSPAIQFTESNVSGATSPACPSPTCTPKTCTSEAAMCGVQSDGCGGDIDCSACPSGEVCESGVCARRACVPKTCTPTTHWVGTPTCACVLDPHLCACGGVYPTCRICK
jgi:hypothetical protein